MKKRTEVFSQRWLRRIRLDRLSSALMSPIINVGTTRENMIVKIISGTISATSPMTVRMPVMMLTAKMDTSFVMAKLKLERRSASPVSRMSEAKFMAMPFAM